MKAILTFLVEFDEFDLDLIEAQALVSDYLKHVRIQDDACKLWAVDAEAQDLVWLTTEW